MDNCHEQEMAGETDRTVEEEPQQIFEMVKLYLDCSGSVMQTHEICTYIAPMQFSGFDIALQLCKTQPLKETE